MKKIVTTLAAVILMITSFSAFAAEENNPLKDVKSEKIISTYLEATTLGSVDLNTFLFAEDFEYRNNSNKDVFSKKEYLQFLKAHKGIVYDCKTSYEILDQSGQTCLAKAIMTFENFTRVDYITLNQGNEGWKVSEVITSYPKSK